MGVRKRWAQTTRTMLNPVDAARRKLTRGLTVTARGGEARRGGELETCVAVEDPDSIETLDAGLACTEYYAVEMHSAEHGSGSGPIHTGDVATRLALSFEVALPLDALPNCRSPEGELFWQVDAKSDEPGRDTRAIRRIVVDAAR